MRPPRGLTPEEASAWARLAATVEPIRPVSPLPKAVAAPAPRPAAPMPAKRAAAPLPHRPPPVAARTGRNPPGNLDSHWDRRLKAGDIAPDLTLDLHDHGLDRAYARLIDGMAQARSMGARTILIVTGKPRPVDPADRATRRGAIRAKILDWLAASEHGAAIAAVRKAHQRHGGDGALYIVLRKGG